MDKFDVAILACLQSNSRMPYIDIGARVGLSPSSCHKRLKVLEAAKIVTGYVAIVAEDRAGLKTNVYVQVTLKSQKEDVLMAFERAAALHGEIMECYLMAGLSDYMLRVLCRDAEDYERVHNNVLTRLPGVDRIVSNFAIRKVLRRTAAPLSAL